MPGYYDYKLRICPETAIAKAQLLLLTLDRVEPFLHEIWDANDKSFPDDVNSKMKAIVELIDEAEDKLEEAKLELAKFFPGHPEVSK